MYRMLVSVCIHSLRRRLLAAVEELLAGLGDSFCARPAVSSCWAKPSRSSSLSRSGRYSLLERLLGVLQRVLAVEELEQEVLLVLEAVVAQADRVLDDVVGPALVLLRLDGQVGAQADA